MPLNRIIEIQKSVIVRDSFGGEISTWATLDKVWTEKRQTSGDERFVPGANIKVATRAATFRIRYGSGVNELMRVVDDQKLVWGIIGLAVVGFNQYHDLICQSDGTRA